jgi:dihydrofolate reductase
MRKVVVTEFMTLDGVMESPHEWSSPYWNDDIARFKNDEIFAADALLLGRVTYDGFAVAWPGRKGKDKFADRINSMPKYVVSKMLHRGSWENTTIIKDNIGDQIRKLKKAEGKDILVYGSATLVNFLMKQELVDHYQILVYPIVLGKGKKMFQPGTMGKLNLVKSTSYKSGVVLLEYQTQKEGK